MERSTINNVYCARVVKIFSFPKRSEFFFRFWPQNLSTRKSKIRIGDDSAQKNRFSVPFWLPSSKARHSFRQKLDQILCHQCLEWVSVFYQNIFNEDYCLSWNFLFFLWVISKRFPAKQSKIHLFWTEYHLVSPWMKW